MITLSAERLITLATTIFIAAGASTTNARLVAQSLVRANLMGHDSHGIMRVPTYVKQIRDGQLFPQAAPETAELNGAVAVIDGHWGFGQITAGYAAEQAITLAKQFGVGSAAVRNGNHAGRLADYVEMATQAGCMSMMVTSGGAPNSNVAPYGGREGIFGTNPVAWGIPRLNGQQPIIIDYATSSVAAGKLDVAINKGERVASGLLLDAQGQPTTDPAAYLNGGVMLPFGEHKGYGLLLFVEIMGRLLAGGVLHSSLEYVRERGSWSVITVWSIEAFTPLEQFLNDAEALAARVQSSKPADGFSAVLLPGELELQTMSRREKEGIPLPETTWTTLMQITADLGLGTELASF